MIILWQVGDRKEGEIQRQSNKNQQVNCREWRANWLTSGKRYELGDVIEVPQQGWLRALSLFKVNLNFK